MKTLLLLLLFLFVPVSEAHDNEASQNIVVDGYQVHLDIAPYPILTGEDTDFFFQIRDTQGEIINVENVRFEALREQYEVREEENNTYVATLSYERFGKQEITFYWNDGTEHQAIFQIEVDAAPPSSNSWIYWVIAGALIVILAGVGVQKKKLNKKDAALYSVGALIVLALGFSVFSYNQWEGNQGCLLQLGENEYVLHCHQELKVEICGEVQEFEWEKGELDRAHTHKSGTRIHWHPPGTVTVPEQLQTLRNLAEDLSFDLTEESIRLPNEEKTYRTGQDDCNTGTPSTLEVFVTESDSEEKRQISPFLDVGLSDEADVEIIYK